MITLTSPNVVALTYVHWSGERVEKRFFIPHNGGAIRDVDTGRQVCSMLRSHGPTLAANDGDVLLRVIRREYKALCRYEGRYLGA